MTEQKRAGAERHRFAFESPPRIILWLLKFARFDRVIDRDCPPAPRAEGVFSASSVCIESSLGSSACPSPGTLSSFAYLCSFSHSGPLESLGLTEYFAFHWQRSLLDE